MSHLFSEFPLYIVANSALNIVGISTKSYLGHKWECNKEIKAFSWVSNLCRCDVCRRYEMVQQRSLAPQFLTYIPFF